MYLQLCLWNCRNDTPQTLLLPVILSTQTPPYPLALGTTCVQGTRACYIPKPHSLQLGNHKVVFPAVTKATDMLWSPKGLPECSELLQSQSLCEEKLFSFQGPGSLIAAVEQRLLLL